MSSCSVEGCGRSLTARGMCRRHYLVEWRAGTFTASPTRAQTTFQCPDDHLHDLEGCWGAHGCRCDRCRHLRKMDRQRRRSRLLAYGRADQISPARVPAEPVRDRLLWLRDAGFGLERVAEAAQVPRSALIDVVYGRRGAGVPRQPVRDRMVRASHAARVMACTPEQIVAAKYSSVGTMRRLQALVAIGHTQTELARRLNMLTSNFSGLILGRRGMVTAATFQAASALFSELWDQPKRGSWADRARRVAESHGWVGPLAWDDIDDPGEIPNVHGDRTEASGIDEMAVEAAMAGERVRLTGAERREAIRRLHAERWSDRRIADRIGVAAETVLRIRQELGLAAVDQAVRVKRDAA
jgi:transcriptional regulator with XRE-family HTH domain